MVFVGMDHGTTGISFTILSSKDNKIIDTFKISREDSKNGKLKAIDEISKRVNIDDIKLMAITYAMGDGFNKIKSINNVKDCGILSINGAGKVTGGGTSVYNEIKNSNINTIMIPGLHKDSTSLNPLFRAAYSHQASPEKVSIVYNSYLKTKWENMIVADLSSNSVNLLIQDGKIYGAIDACLGAMGFVHGPLDLQMIREIDEGKKTANESFSNAGAVKIANVNNKVQFIKDDILNNYIKNDKNAELAIDTMVMTIAMEIFGLIGISEKNIEGIVLTGSLGAMKEPFNFEDKLNKYLKNQYKIEVIGVDSGSIGAAQIARDVYNGKKNIMGIEVDF